MGIQGGSDLSSKCIAKERKKKEGETGREKKKTPWRKKSSTIREKEVKKRCERNGRVAEYTEQTLWRKLKKVETLRIEHTITVSREKP